MERTRKPTHPGEFFEGVLHRLDINVTQASIMLGVQRGTLSKVIHGRSGLSLEMAKRWGKFTDTTTVSWYNMQVALDLWEIENSEMAEDIKPYQTKR